MSVTITPQKNDSAILIIATFSFLGVNNNRAAVQITDSANNAISGAESMELGGYTFSAAAGKMYITAIGYSTPATTSAVTYKLRFKTPSGTVYLNNQESTGQVYAIEVSA
jgi:hypothetical protein